MRLHEISIDRACARGKQTVIAAVVLKLLVVKMNHVGAHVVEEVLVVRDNEQSVLPLGQVAIKPDHSVEVQMIGRLIE